MWYVLALNYNWYQCSRQERKSATAVESWSKDCVLSQIKEMLFSFGAWYVICPVFSYVGKGAQ
jgi:hypothetical protein